MARVHNFSAGPATLPECVLRECAAEMLDYRGCGMSVMEMSHRSGAFQSIMDDAEATLRRLLDIPENYRVLFLQGGATLQFAGVPLNLMRTRRAGYVVSGNWSKRAWQEARRYGDAIVIASSEDGSFDRVPAFPDSVDQTLDYVYVCQNETVFGNMMRDFPQTGDVPLVADVSSCFLSQPLDVGAFGLVYAGVQKNAGPAGTAVVIVRDDLIAQGPALADVCPTYLDLRVEADKGSLLNTPNCWAIYVCGKVFHWIEDQGGLKAMGRSNWDKVRLLYDYLDQSDLFCGTVRARDRSIANVTFRTTSPELDDAFVEAAAERGIVNVRGHRLVGGMRASCYNAVSPASVQELVTCMADFEATHAGAAPENATRAGATPTQVTSGSPADPKGVRSG